MATETTFVVLVCLVLKNDLTLFVSTFNAKFIRRATRPHHSGNSIPRLHRKGTALAGVGIELATKRHWCCTISTNASKSNAESFFEGFCTQKKWGIPRFGDNQTTHGGAGVFDPLKVCDDTYCGYYFPMELFLSIMGSMYTMHLRFMRITRGDRV